MLLRSQRMKHPIQTYLDSNEISQAEFARSAELTPSFLNDVIQGRSLLSAKSMRRVLIASYDEIDIHEVLDWKPPPPHE